MTKLNKKTLTINGVEMPLKFTFKAQLEVDALAKEKGVKSEDFVSEPANIPVLLQIMLKYGGNIVELQQVEDALEELTFYEILDKTKALTDYFTPPNESTQAG